MVESEHTPDDAEKTMAMNDKGSVGMLPIGILMREHRLIESITELIVKESALISNTGQVDSVLVNLIIDLFRTYVDQTHHGKEEEILFTDLRRKHLSPEHEKTLNELIEEHAYARRTVANLEDANREYVQGNKEASRNVFQFLNDLNKLYSSHIEKEDKKFFIPSMKYFDRQDLRNMLDEFLAFDREMSTHNRQD